MAKKAKTPAQKKWQAEEDDEGAVVRFLHWAFGRSWRTSLAGWASMLGTGITAIATVVESPGVLKWAPVVVQGCMSLGIMLSKDAKVSGANRPPK